MPLGREHFYVENNSTIVSLQRTKKWVKQGTK